MSDVFYSGLYRIFFIDAFWLMVPKSFSSLYLVYSTGHCSPTKYNMTKNCVYSILCSSGRVYKGETCRPLKVRLEEHHKEVCLGEVEKSGIADHIWKEKGNHQPWWDQIKIIDREEHWGIQRLKEAADMLGYSDQMSWPSIEINTI